VDNLNGIVTRNPHIIPLPFGSIVSFDLGTNSTQFNLSGIVDNNLKELFVEDTTGFSAGQTIRGDALWNSETTPGRAMEGTPGTPKAVITRVSPPNVLGINGVYDDNGNQSFFVHNELITNGTRTTRVYRPLATKQRLEQAMRCWQLNGILTLHARDEYYPGFFDRSAGEFSLVAGREDRFNYRLTFSEAYQHLPSYSPCVTEINCDETITCSPGTHPEGGECVPDEGPMKPTGYVEVISATTADGIYVPRGQKCRLKVLIKNGMESTFTNTWQLKSRSTHVFDFNWDPGPPIALDIPPLSYATVVFEAETVGDGYVWYEIGAMIVDVTEDKVMYGNSNIKLAPKRWLGIENFTVFDDLYPDEITRVSMNPPLHSILEDGQVFSVTLRFRHRGLASVNGYKIGFMLKFTDHNDWWPSPSGQLLDLPESFYWLEKTVTITGTFTPGATPPNRWITAIKAVQVASEPFVDNTGHGTPSNIISNDDADVYGTSP
jgi:hypothetical protein